MNKKNDIKNTARHPLPHEIREEIESALKKCYACSKCTSGCPFASAMDYPPSVILKWLALGETEKVLKSNAIWICSSCQNCHSRCPFDVDIPLIMDLLKEHAYGKQLSKKEKAIQLFHKIFLKSVKRFGRIHEASFIGEWKLFSGKWFSDLGLAKKMFLKGKLHIMPAQIKNKEEVRKLFIHKDKKK